MLSIGIGLLRRSQILLKKESLEESQRLMYMVDPYLIVSRCYGSADPKRFLVLEKPEERSFSKRFAAIFKQSLLFGERRRESSRLLLAPSSVKAGERSSFCLLRGESSRGQDNKFSFGLWGIGGLFLAAYAFQSQQEVRKVYALAPINALPNNSRIQDPVEDFGLIKDDARGTYMVPQRFIWLDGFSFCYTVGGPKCPLRATLIDGQLVWKAFDEIDERDVKAVAEHYKERGRSIHVNTGIHANPEGKAKGDSVSGNFLIEDVRNFSKYSNVSFHIVSPHALPLTLEHEPEKDFLDAWCYSEETVDFSFKDKSESEKQKAMEEAVGKINKRSVPQSDLINEFFDLGYRSIGVSKAKYVEPTRIKDGKKIGLKEEVAALLDSLSFCYVKGIGGLGKSRIAQEFEKQGLEEKEKKGKYSDVLFISLKSTAGQANFLEHAAKALTDNKGASKKDVLEKYFGLLYRAAQLQEKKKMLIIIDNIDTTNDIEALRNIYGELRRFHSPKKDSPFELLVTGRVDLSNFLVDNGLDGKNTVVELENYKNEESIWQLFLEIFLENNKNGQFKGALEVKKEDLLKVFKKYGYHTGFTAVLAQLFAENCRFQSIDKTMEAVSGLIDTAIGDTRLAPDDYEVLAKVLNAPLDFLDKKHGGKAKDLFYILALMSDGHIRHELLLAVLKKHFGEKEIPVLNRVMIDFSTHGLIQSLGGGGSLDVFSMPQFYNTIMRYNLSKLYNQSTTAKDKIEFTVNLILQETTAVLDSSDPKPKENIDGSIMCLLSLCDYANKIEGTEKVHGPISQKAIKYISERWKVLKYRDVDEKLEKLFESIPRGPEYSMDPVLYSFITGKEGQNIYEDLIRKLNYQPDSNRFSESIKLLKRANNFYVLYLSKSKDRKRKLKTAITNYLSKLSMINDIDNVLGYYSIINEIEKNIKGTDRKQEDLTIFPEIEFQEISAKDRKEAEKWKEEHPRKEKAVNLSDARLGMALRVLAYHLLEDRSVEELNLSHNYLGRRLEGKVIHDLLRYPGPLKVLKLNNNSLHREGFAHLIEGLEENTALEHLVLNNNSLDDTHIEELCRVLKNHKSIKKIELHNNKFTNKGLSLLKELIKSNQNIQLITTEYSYRAHHRGVKKFERRSLNAGKKIIEAPQVSAEDQKKAEKWKREHPRKGEKAINLSNVQLGMGFRALTYHLLEERSVEEIDLSHNCLGFREEGKVISDLLRYPGSLKVLKLNNNTLWLSGFSHLIEGLKENTTLEHLVLNNNSLQDGHIDQLCRILKRHQSIKRIELHHNKFGQIGLARLVDLMLFNKNICEITTYEANKSSGRHSTYCLKRDKKGNIIKLTKKN